MKLKKKRKELKIKKIKKSLGYGRRGRPPKVKIKSFNKVGKKEETKKKRGRPRKGSPELLEVASRVPKKDVIELKINEEKAVKLKYKDEYTGWFLKNPAVLKVMGKIYVAFSESFKEFLPEDMINKILEFRYYNE